jgi:hypothetical protein
MRAPLPAAGTRAKYFDMWKSVNDCTSTRAGHAPLTTPDYNPAHKCAARQLHVHRDRISTFSQFSQTK